MSTPKPDQLPCEIVVRTSPNAKIERVRIERDANGREIYRVSVNAPAESGKANKAVIALLAREMGLPKSAFKILRGEKSREKTIRIAPS